MIKKFDRVVLQMIGAEIEKALGEVGKKHGVAIKRGNGTYADDYATLKLDMSVVQEDGTPLTKEAADFKRYATIYGFQAEDLGRTFTQNGKKWIIRGWKPAARLSLVCEEAFTHKMYKLNPDQALKSLKGEGVGKV